MTNPNEPIHGTVVHDGLTKREYFAAMAMQGLLVNYPSKDLTGWTSESFADTAIEAADALITALNKKTE